MFLFHSGGTKVQLRESLKYILINVLSSFLFLVAVAYLYAMTGTLNLAHLSVRVAEVGQDGLMTTVALLFLIVFGLKAGFFSSFGYQDRIVRHQLRSRLYLQRY